MACEICERSSDGVMPLWTPAPENVQVAAGWDYPTGWSVVMKVRRSGQCWHGAEEHRYDSLSTDELLDVVTSELAQLFGVRTSPA